MNDGINNQTVINVTSQPCRSGSDYSQGASSNFGNTFSVLGASAFLPFLPMAPIQVLTNNLSAPA